MTSALVQCDGGQIPIGFSAAAWDQIKKIKCLGPDADLFLKLDNLTHNLLQLLDSTAADLVRVAAYVYAADQSVSRGGPTDIYGTGWYRHFGMVIPVNSPELWNSPPVRSALIETLGFLSDDHWDFSFTQASAVELQQLPLSFDPNDLHQLLGNPDSVVLFSGGTDSLCAALEACLVDGKRPVLVSHRSSQRAHGRQSLLAKELRKRIDVWNFPHIGIRINRMGYNNGETTQRTRSFLYASMATAIASQLAIPSVVLADNGITTIQPPINAQLIGARATRSTHPKFIGFFNGLASSLFATGSPMISNPFQFLTRPEVLALLSTHSVATLLQETNSCAHARKRLRSEPHCGVCSQCVERRFASIAAELEEYDLPELYGHDIFLDALPEGQARTMAVSYMRFAIEVQQDANLLQSYPQLYDCILPADPDPGQTAERLVAMLKRHASTVIDVMTRQVAKHDLVTEPLPDTCLVRLVGAGLHLGGSLSVNMNLLPTPSATVADPVKVFFSYAHEDDILRQELSKHLSPLRREGIIAEWYDGLINPGHELTDEILAHLQAADVILLLVSSDFIASEFCWNEEVERAIARHNAGTARVIPVILRPVEWLETPLRKLKALPKDGNPVTDLDHWGTQDKALVDVAKGVRVSIEELRGNTFTQP